jgi:transcriptional regulator with XRE-family HTH domain
MLDSLSSPRDDSRDDSNRPDGLRAQTTPSGASSETPRDTIASRLRTAREISGLTQGQVAKLMRLHRPTITEIEAGRRRVAAEELAEFARHYRTSVAWLTGQEAEIADPADDRIRLAARELSKLSDEDLERLLRVLAAIRTRSEPAR